MTAGARAGGCGATMADAHHHYGAGFPNANRVGKSNPKLVIRIDTPEWLDRAGCIGEDPDALFPRTAIEAREVIRRNCDWCPVKTECAQYALDTGATHGIWGGKLMGEEMPADHPSHEPRRGVGRPRKNQDLLETVYELRAQGLTEDAIAQRLGYKTKETFYKACRAALKASEAA